ncbi:hypothetical protein B6V73_14740 [Thioclava sp. JM3]|uniref:hypothetical protein n=1 Tax=unclassified Thioclava TaxID=2621713 RepID=UPI000B53A45F|nr:MULTISPECIES: hypothetical protein [unclassified Thioclava]OWY15786.1 hypothetical protein B6V73_14740 [Thioclava sp. JM3]PWE49403.1 hypothetical protein DEM26_13195 [Thioclava sp. NG1]
MNKLIFNLKKVLRGEDGAVTVDWVVLTASLVALGFMATAMIWTQTAGTSGKIAKYIDKQEVTPAFTADELADDEG